MWVTVGEGVCVGVGEGPRSDPTQLTTPDFVSMHCSHAWNPSSLGVHSAVPSRLRVLREVRPVSDSGKGPERVELPLKSIRSRFERLPSSAGISPLNSLPD